MYKKYLITVLLFLQVGCDTFYGISRQAKVSFIPKSDCVIQAIRKVEHVKFKDYIVKKGGRAVTITGIKKPDVIHRYTYKIDQYDLGLIFVQSYNNQINLGHSYITMKTSQLQRKLDIIQPIMVEIESILEEECNLKINK